MALHTPQLGDISDLGINGAMAPSQHPAAGVHLTKIAQQGVSGPKNCM